MNTPTIIKSLWRSCFAVIGFWQQNPARETLWPLKSCQYTFAISSILIWAHQNKRITLNHWHQPFKRNRAGWSDRVLNTLFMRCKLPRQGKYHNNTARNTSKHILETQRQQNPSALFDFKLDFSSAPCCCFYHKTGHATSERRSMHRSATSLFPSIHNMPSSWLGHFLSWIFMLHLCSPLHIFFLGPFIPLSPENRWSP